MFFSPFDISKDGGNDFIDGVKFSIRQNEYTKEKIENFIKKNNYNIVYPYQSSLDVLNKIVEKLGLTTNDLSIEDKNELLNLIFENE